MSSATPNEAVVAANEIEMARLSAAANATPKAERKSSRFHGIFKKRHGSNTSSNPAAPHKSSAPADSSPLSSPDMRPGFQQIGLLPSERSMHSLQQIGEDELDCGETTTTAAPRRSELETKGETATNNDDGEPTDLGATRSYGGPALARLQVDNQLRRKSSFAHSVKDAFSRHPIDKVDREVVAFEVAMSNDMSSRAMSDTNQRTSLPMGSSHKIAEAMYSECRCQRLWLRQADFVVDKNNSSVTGTNIEDSASFRTLPNVPDTDRDGAFTEDDSLDRYDSLSNKHTNDILKTTRMSRQTPRSFEIVHAHGINTTLLDEDGHSSPRKSFASNIFDDDSSLSQGIRGYVTSKIAEALVEHDRAHASDGDAVIGPPVHLTIKIDATRLAKANKFPRSSISGVNANVFIGPSTIGPLRITNARLAKDIQLGAMAIYVAVLLDASLLGPKCLLLAVWRLKIALGVYIVVLRQLHWTENAERDVLLAPVVFAASVATGLGEQILDHVRAVMVAILAGVFERVAQGCGVHVRTK